MLRANKIFRAFLLVVALLLLSSELALRWYGFANPPLVYKDADYGYANLPDQHIHRFGRHIDYNHQGLRSDELAAKPRILCIGDSVTNGGVPTDQQQTFPYQLEHLLQSAGRNVQVLNASTAKWGPGNEAAFLARHGTYNAQTVIIEAGTNDYWQLKETSQLPDLDPTLPIHRPWSAIGELATRYLLPRYFPQLSPKGEITAYTEAHRETSEDALVANLGYWRQMIRQAKASGARVLFVMVPNREETLLIPGDKSSGHEWFPETKARIKALCADEGVPVLDLRNTLDANWTPSPYRDEVHPNQIGNRIIAQAIAAELIKH